MEASLLNPNQRYAAAALFAIALHHSQVDQARPSTPLTSLAEETISEGVSIGKRASVSDEPQLWIHENSGLLLPVFRFLGVDNHAWHGLKETAGSSSQVRHHLGSFLSFLSDLKDGPSSEINDKELALVKAVDAMVLSMEGSPVSYEEASASREYENKCRGKYSRTATTSESNETTKGTSPNMSIKEKTYNRVGGQTCDKPVKEATLLSYERKVTILYSLISACLADDTEGIGNCLQQRKGYDARHRVALRLLATWLGIKWLRVEAMEIMVAYFFMDSVKGVNEEKRKTSEVNWDKWKRGGVIGAAALAGGTMLAISGAAGAGLTGSKVARRIGNIEEFEFKPVGGNHNQGRVAVGILVSGLIYEIEDYVGPWEGHCNNLERYALLWESKNLIALSTAIQDWLTSKIATQLMIEGAMLTVLSTLVAAFALPATLVTASDLIDSQWAVAMDRSDKAGKLLAEVLLKGLQGNRPVTLIGISLGARAIFKCLQCLAETGGDNAGLVERVVLLGAPVSIKDENWEAVRKMVAGRFVNAYSTNDWTLGITFRASLLSKGLAGIQPADDGLGIENIDVTQLIEGHTSYLWKTKQILGLLELDNYYSVFRTTDAEPAKKKDS
ncbi:Alpha/Beta hydrolase fold containing protein [Parasponia andersonii]|uniref:Alpha/Beta hydrolase fold containing protein n=1 Tax=Parasponia andersonii TaxID=3476 RepID=A0A2P5BTA2_PARAD|nr:Alpha/Beta hydrolase fold containing protein [Parasponia andersonii]